MDIEYLRDFLAVVDEGGFRRAASRRGVAQSTLSKHISAVERELGGQLLDRGMSRIELTPLGEMAEKEARMVLFSYDKLVKDSRAMSRRIMSTLRVGVFKGYRPTDDLMAMAQEELREQMSSLVIEDVDIAGASALDKVLSGELDAAIMYLPHNLDEALWRATHLYEEPLAALIPHSHRLFGRETIEPADLDGETLAVPGGPAASDAKDTICALLEAAGCSCDYTELVSRNTQRYIMMQNIDRIRVNGAGTFRSSPLTTQKHDYTLRNIDGLHLVEALVTRASDKRPAIAELQQLLGRIVAQTDLTLYWA